jgi:hypothetical protein
MAEAEVGTHYAASVPGRYTNELEGRPRMT